MQRWQRGLHAAIALACIWVAACSSARAQAANCGVVLMHGKWGMPGSPYLKTVVQKLEPHCPVKLIEMPWSRNRLYDRPYADALTQIRMAVAEFRQSGAQWVAVGGQSFGANAALAYMAQVGDADAVLPLAPGHVPENFYQMPEVRRSVDAARQLLDAGQGETLVEMTDINQGQRRPVKVSAASLWSYFNPQGWGNMALSAQSFIKPVPVFWAIGTQDPLHGAASEDIYQRLPPHPDSRYLVVRANHANTPEVAADELLSWVLARTGR
jgi:pimeloyl-ACP methyl ester carboxylesterase